MLLLYTVKLIPSGYSHSSSEQCLPTCVEAADYTYVTLDIPTPVRPKDLPPSTPPPPPPQRAKSKHRISLPPQPVLTHAQQPDTDDEDGYEKQIVPAEVSMQQKIVQKGWRRAQPQSCRSPPPVVPAHLNHSPKPKPKPKGVPSTAIPLVLPMSTPRHPPPVAKKPIMLSEWYIPSSKLCDCTQHTYTTTVHVFSFKMFPQLHTQKNRSFATMWQPS